VNVFPSAVRDVVSGFHPRTTGEIQILLEKPGPKVDPPLRVVAECAGPSANDELKDEIERKIRSTLTVPASVELVSAGTLPRYEMKGQLVKQVEQNKM
jgi:phenylacetate-CoA ligase